MDLVLLPLKIVRGIVVKLSFETNLCSEASPGAMQSEDKVIATPA